jgi:hypothetical protein
LNIAQFTDWLFPRVGVEDVVENLPQFRAAGLGARG